MKKVILFENYDGRLHRCIFAGLDNNNRPQWVKVDQGEEMMSLQDYMEANCLKGEDMRVLCVEGETLESATMAQLLGAVLQGYPCVYIKALADAIKNLRNMGIGWKQDNPFRCLQKVKSFFRVSKDDGDAIFVPERIFLCSTPEITKHNIACAAVALESALIATWFSFHLKRETIFRTAEFLFINLAVFKLCIEIFGRPRIPLSADGEIHHLAAELLFQMLDVLRMDVGGRGALAHHLAGDQVRIVLLQERAHRGDHAGHAEKQNPLSLVQQLLHVLIHSSLINIDVFGALEAIELLQTVRDLIPRGMEILAVRRAHDIASVADHLPAERRGDAAGGAGQDLGVIVQISGIDGKIVGFEFFVHDNSPTIFYIINIY